MVALLCSVICFRDWPFLLVIYYLYIYFSNTEETLFHSFIIFETCNKTWSNL